MPRDGAIIFRDLVGKLDVLCLQTLAVALGVTGERSYRDAKEKGHA
jgi:hypothetical protein